VAIVDAVLILAAEPRHGLHQLAAIAHLHKIGMHARLDGVADQAREEAQALFSRALRLQIESIGEGHPDTADTLARLADVAYSRNDLSQAEQLLRRAVSVAAGAYGDDHVKTAVYLAKLAALLSEHGNTSEAQILVCRFSEGRAAGIYTAVVG
jgi:tetratricopeptide (TPR) repeat protein